MFHLNHFITKATCFNSQISTMVGLTLTNRQKSFKKNTVQETGKSVDHMRICLILKHTFSKSPHETIQYQYQQIIKKVVQKKL